MRITKNTLLASVAVLALSLMLVAGLQHYIRSVLLAQNFENHVRLASLVVDSLDTVHAESVAHQLAAKLDNLPGWSGLLHDRQGKLLGQGGRPAKGIDHYDINKERLDVAFVSEEQDWIISQHPLAAHDKISPQLTVTLFSSRQTVMQLITELSAAILFSALVIGGLIWLILRLHSRHIKSDIRSYIRANRKELTHDTLTGLPNREILMDRIEHGMAQARRQTCQLALLYIALDRFSQINESMGHAYGDQVLRAVAARLSSESRDSDTLVRIEGDQFALLMTNVNHADEIERVASRIHNALQAPIETGNKKCVITASIGVSVYDISTSDAETMIINAYTAMIEMKQRNQGNGYLFFKPEMNSQVLLKAELDAELYAALENDEFKLYYQPKVDAVTGNIKGMEALIRWQHPTRGMVSPIEFVPHMEKSGLIVMVGEWVLREACRVNKAWQDEGLPALKVSVNVATPQFKQDGFVDMIKEILESSRLDPSYLEIEVTESCLMDDDDSNIHILDEIKALGVSISVDDFGTGYSSLSYLKRFPIDTLKIDRSFITNVQDRKANDNAAIVTAIMALSHSLRLEVVAEGVETPQELAYLHALGCRTIQGFLFSRPLSEQEFKALLVDSVSLRQTLDTVREALK